MEPNMTGENEAGWPDQHRRNKEARRQALMDAATVVFAEHGYDAATTREIAERAGCSEGLIHRYFDGKRGLLTAVIRSRIETVAREIFSPASSTEDVPAEIEQVLMLHLFAMWEARDFMRVAISQAIINPELGREIGENITKQRVHLIVERLRRHQEAGRIRADVDLEEVAEVITWLGFSLGFFAQAVIGMDRDHVRKVAARAATVISRGIEASGRANV
jgi:AcrR family transcriptional regulator